MNFAVIKTGGKQYKAEVGQTLTIERIKPKDGVELKTGDKLTFDEVLLTQAGDKVTVGAPTIAGGKVEGEITSVGRNAKVIVMKYKQKSRYMKKNGHRQPHLKVKITKI